MGGNLTDNIEGIAFRYELAGVGWASARFSSGQDEVGMVISYLGRGLSSLTECCVELIQEATGKPSYPCSRYEFKWLGEPWGYLVVIDVAIFDDRVQVRVWRYEDIPTNPRPEDGVLVFDATGPFVSFVSSVVDEALRILDVHGLVGYRLEWHGEDFPVTDVVRLGHYLTRARAGNVLSSAVWDRLSLSEELGLLTGSGARPADDDGPGETPHRRASERSGGENLDEGQGRVNELGAEPPAE